MPVGKLGTNDYTADWTQAVGLMLRINEAGNHLADLTGPYDTNEIIEHCEAKQIESVIPSKNNRIQPRDHDKNLY